MHLRHAFLIFAIWATSALNAEIRSTHASSRHALPLAARPDTLLRSSNPIPATKPRARAHHLAADSIRWRPHLAQRPHLDQPIDSNHQWVSEYSSTQQLIIDAVSTTPSALHDTRLHFRIQRRTPTSPSSHTHRSRTLSRCRAHCR